MTKLTINPGVCGFIAKVEAISDGGMAVTVKVETGCESVTKMFKDLGDTFNPYEICMARPGAGPLYEYAAQNFISHGCCPTIAGIIKAMEAECGLALKRDVSFTFEQG